MDHLSAVGFVTGLPFGWALESSKMATPEVLQGQFEFTRQEQQRNEMLKTFTGALGVSALCIGALRGAGLIEGLQIKPLHPAANVLGGLLLGAGIYKGGACPGTVMAQVPNYTENAAFTLLGGLAGTLAYGAVVHPYAKKYLHGSGAKATVMSALGCSEVNEAFFLIPFGAAVLTANYFIDQKFPDAPEPVDLLESESENDVQKQQSGKFDWSKLFYNKQSVVIGMLQLPALLLAKKYLSTSTSYATVTGHVIKAVPKRFQPGDLTYFEGNMHKPLNYWQVFLDLGIVAGAYISVYCRKRATDKKRQSSSSADTSTAVVAKQEWMSPLQRLSAFTGGFILLLGARLAGGCTSGHGISGVSQLGLSSIITSIAMFAGGSAVAVIAPN